MERIGTSIETLRPPIVAGMVTSRNHADSVRGVQMRIKMPGETYPMGGSARPRHIGIHRRWLAVAVPVILALIGSAVSEPASAKSTTKRKPSTKSRVKIIDLSPPKSYLLTVDGRFTVTRGDIVEEGTLSAPNIKVRAIKYPGGPKIFSGAGNGRVVDRLTVVGKNCELSGTISFAMFVGSVSVADPSSDDEQAELLQPMVVPVGKVGLSVGGVAVGLAAAANPAASTYDLGGIKKMNCTVSTDPLIELPLTLAAQGANEALAAAIKKPLLFASAGESIDRKSDDGNPTYFFTFNLKKA